MSRITLYLDDAMKAAVEQAATASGMSVSQWIIETIRRHTSGEWLLDCLALAGTFADFQLQDDASEADRLQSADVLRLRF